MDIGLGTLGSSDVPAAYSGSGTKRAAYDYDTMGRVTSYKEYDTNGTTVRYERSGITYNDKSQLTHDVVTNWKTDNNTWVTTTDYDYKYDSNSDGDYIDAGDLCQGVLTHSRSTVTKNGVSQPTTDSKYGYTWFDGAVQDSITYKPNIGNSTSGNYIRA